MTKTLERWFPIALTHEGGLNLEDNLDNIGENELIECKNFVVQGKRLIKRRGFNLVATPSTFATRQIRMLGYVYRDPSFGTSRQMLFANEGNAINGTGNLFYSTDGGVTWTEVLNVAAHFGQTAAKVFQYNDIAWIQGGTALWDVNLSTLAVTVTGTVSGLPLDIMLDRYFLSSSDNLFFSEPGAPRNVPAANFLSVNAYDGQRITGGIAYKDRLVIFKQASIYILYATGTPANWQLRKLSSELGSTGMWTYIVVDDYIYFISHSGIYRTNLSTVEEISTSFRDLFKNRSWIARNQTNLGVGYEWITSWKNKVICCVDIAGAAGTASFSNRRHRIFVFHTDTEVWTEWVPNIASSNSDNFGCPNNMVPVPITSTLSNDESFPIGLYGGSQELTGRIWLYSEDGAYQDDGAQFTCILRTGTVLPDSFGEYKKFPSIMIECRQGSENVGSVEFFDPQGSVISALNQSLPAQASMKDIIHKIRGPGYMQKFSYRVTFTATADANGVEVRRSTLLARTQRPVQIQAAV